MSVLIVLADLDRMVLDMILNKAVLVQGSLENGMGVRKYGRNSRKSTFVTSIGAWRRRDVLRRIFIDSLTRKTAKMEREKYPGQP